MKILIANDTIIPVHYYGGTERVIWYLGKELVKLGHEVSYLVKKGSTCDFARIIPLDNARPIDQQIPVDIDLIHFHTTWEHMDRINQPYVVTMHGNGDDTMAPLNINTIFVSQNHAQRFGSTSFVYNGLDWNDYSPFAKNAKREYFHFLGNAAWRIKNVQGAIDLIQLTRFEKLKVLGGVRFNLNMGWRFTFTSRVGFIRKVGAKTKDKLLNHSKGLIFPVRWHEPFGLAIIESLYYGCPVVGTPYGSLPELVNKQIGFLSIHKSELLQALENIQAFDSVLCHETALENFNSRKMAMAYLEKYSRVMDGDKLNILNPRKIHADRSLLDWD